MMPKTLLTSLALVAVAHAPAAQADAVGFEFGGGAWQKSYSGTASDADGRSFDVEDDLGIDDNRNGYFWAALEHPVPVLPNLRVERSSLDTDGEGTVTRQFTFKGQTFTANEDVESTLDIQQTDLIAYYEVLDNWASLDIGLNVRMLDGDVRIESQDRNRSEERSFSSPVPMAHAALRFDVPLAGAWVGAQGSGISYSGSRFIDVRAMAGYEFDFGLGFEAGYRRQNLKIDDIDDFDADLDADGAFAGAYFNF